MQDDSCGDSVAMGIKKISLFPHLHTPLVPLLPVPNKPLVSVDVKHHGAATVIILILLLSLLMCCLKLCFLVTSRDEKPSLVERWSLGV